MIDWFALAANGAWILACALALAVFSIANWQALRGGLSLRHVAGRRANRVTLGAAGALFCLGMAGSAGLAWERIAWVAGGVVVAAYTWRAVRM